MTNYVSGSAMILEIFNKDILTDIHTKLERIKKFSHTKEELSDILYGCLDILAIDTRVSEAAKISHQSSELVSLTFECITEYNKMESLIKRLITKFHLPEKESVL